MHQHTLDYTVARPRETERVAALQRLELLDTAPSVALDRITRMAAQLFDLPIAAVSLTDTDRQWFKSRVGVEHQSIPRSGAPCAEVSDTAHVLVINDLQAHERYAGSLLAQNGIRFYAGAPLVTHDGFCLGAMCVLGVAPRGISAAETAALQDLAAMVMSQIELQHAMGRVDPLSRLPNRTQFTDDFADLILDLAPGTRGLAALVNLASPEQLSNAVRVMGATYLDEIVGEAAQMLRNQAASGRRVYHVSPTQFVFLAPTGMDEAHFCAALELWLEQRSRAVTSRFVTTASIGVAAFVVGQTSCNELLRNVHSAAQDAAELHQPVCMYSAAQDLSYQRRFTLINEFGAALEQPDQLRLVFQPKIVLAGGACIGAEALLRWTHPVLGEVSPAEFIPVIEHTSMARATTAWVLAAAMRQLAEWRARGIIVQVAVNVSATNLLEVDFVTRLTSALAAHGLPASALSLEVTESAIMEHPKVAQATLAAIAAAGVHLAVDDFGTGYSSLAYLQALPVNVVKVDQSFIFGMEHDERKRTLVTTMIDLSHDLGYRVVAEGVETEAAAALLGERGCDEAQGYLFARPLSAAVFTAWFEERRRVLARDVLRPGSLALHG